ncbi:MAG: efflux RND transporter periplasmic adaptor subunit [Planctomycetaceae bacterium]|nr:efflux RND transporter periplasmic adaptor subunit [Planctomycetaceae bacterium]
MQRNTPHAHDLRPTAPRAALATASLLSIGIAGFLAACSEKPVAPPPPAPAVRTDTVATQDIPVAYSFPATIQSPRTVDINARVPGWLQSQDTPDGARVKDGQVLYRIDPSQYRIALDAAQAKLAQAKAQEEVAQARLDTATAQRTYAQATYDRNKDLVASGAVSQERFDQFTAQLAEAKAAVEQANADIASAKANELAAKADIANAELNLSYCTVACPLDGLMGPSKYFEGSLVGEGGKQLLNTVVQTDPMWAGFSPSANYLPVILANQKAGTLAAKVRLEGAASNPTPATPLRNDQPAPEAEARLVFVDSQVTGTSDTVLMRVEFANPDTVFRPGAYGTVEIGLGTQKDAIVVPEGSVFARQTELFVWRVKADDTVESVRIDAVAKHANLVVVAPGTIAKGDRIVVEGVGKLKAGQKIREAKAADAATETGASGAASTKVEGK